MNEFTHQPVMLNEIISGLSIKKDGIYIDATFGRGGYSRAILNCLGGQGHVIAIDKDTAAIAQAQELAASDARFRFHHASFSELTQIVSANNCDGKIAGIVFDLGVSSPQLEDSSRGFSFMRDGPLDMRMDTTRGMSAAEFIATVEQDQLASILKEYGEERFAKRIALAITRERGEKAITTTGQLSDIIARAVPFREKHKHPATRSFQAIRIFVNNELGELTAALQQSLGVLEPTGRLVVVSFHSLEDRIVKRFMKDMARDDDLPKSVPIMKSESKARLRILVKGKKPQADEIENNVRSRSAMMRVAEKIR